MSAIHLNQNVLDTLYTSFRIQFKDGMQKASNVHEDIATPIRSVSTIENYPIIDQYGKMKEWIGPRTIDRLRVRTLSVKNRDFESSVRVSRNAIADEQSGIYGALVAGLGMTAQNLWDDLVFEALCNPGKWLDDLDFYSTTRKYDDTNAVVNKSTSALSSEAYETARSTMMSYVGHEGTPLNIVPDVLIVGPNNAAAARAIVEAQFVRTEDGLVDNPLRGTAKLIVSTRLVGAHANKWFLLATNDVIKPVILQQRELPTLTRIDSPASEIVFKYNENLYGTNARGAAALTVPHLVYGGGM